MQKILIIGAGANEKEYVTRVLKSHHELKNTQVEFIENAQKSLQQIPKEKNLTFTLIEKPLQVDVFEVQISKNRKFTQNPVPNFKIKLPKIFTTTKRIASIRNNLWRK